HQSARVTWEYLDASGIWTAAGADDDTRSLTLDGAVKLKPGGPMTKAGVHAGVAGLYYVRARFRAGAYDAAPVATRIVLNGVDAEQTTARPKIYQARGTGESDQTLPLEPAPVTAGSVELKSVESGDEYSWTRKPDFDSSGRADRHYLLDAEAGLIRFGDGEHGLAPPAGSTLRASYLTTRAAQG